MGALSNHRIFSRRQSARRLDQRRLDIRKRASFTDENRRRRQSVDEKLSRGEGSCECCKLGIAFANSGKTIYMVDRQVDDKQIRNHVLRKSTDGGATFGAPIEISDDGWQVFLPALGAEHRARSSRPASCQLVHARPLGKGSRHLLQLVKRRRQKLRAAAAGAGQHRAGNALQQFCGGEDDTVYLVWSNLDANNRAQIFMRTISVDGKLESDPTVEPRERRREPAGFALSKNQLHVAWTETDDKTRAPSCETPR